MYVRDMFGESLHTILEKILEKILKNRFQERNSKI